ncbi:hypothetical protein [Nakamurella panacisegetis]|uniref:hypothetical protein n=1 Tax=Nakamurella panacisegetis TaxID=1090615 RepID=UPI0018D30A7C|nr:hypothetical protein [Nakamurella panacisegetis]
MEQARSEGVDPIGPQGLLEPAIVRKRQRRANVKSVQMMQGHKSAATTLDVYADLFPDDLDLVAIALDQAASAAVVPKTAQGQKKGQPPTGVGWPFFCGVTGRGDRI